MDANSLGSEWFYSKPGVAANDHIGPLSWDDLRSAARSGVLSRADLVWNESYPDWRPAASVPGLFVSMPPVPPVPPASAYGMAPGHGEPAPARSRMLLWLLPLIALIAVGAGLGTYFGTRGGHHDEAALITTGSSSTASSTSEAVFSQQEGEIYLEASGAAGPESFAGEQFVAQGPSTTLKIPNPVVTLPPVTTTTATTATTTSQGAGTGQSATTAPPAAQPVVLASYPGDTPALYGGSKSKVISDKEGELRFLEQNPLKAAAFCEALNSDPTLRWSGGNQVRPDQLRDYFAELTPMLLARDIRVTNYGYRNGHPTPRQSVLQAGQLVLVDRYGVPRKRCECGNPLTPPRPVSRPPIYTGPRWPGFDPTTIIIIQQTTVIINNFTLINIHTGETFGRPPGTEGGSDGQAGSTTGSSSTEPGSGAGSETTAPPSGGPPTAYRLDVIMDRVDAGSKRQMHIEWSVPVTVNADGTLSGSGPGGWHVEGVIYEKQTATGTFSADAAFGVDVSGNVETSGEDRNLRIKEAMTDYQLQNLKIDTTSDRALAQAAVEAQVAGWLKDAFTDFLLPMVSSDIYGAALAGSYSGSVNLIPQR